MLIGCSLCLWLEAPVLDATELVREEPIPIQTIIADPQAFNMRKVRLQGIIQTLERIPQAGICGGHPEFLPLMTKPDNSQSASVGDVHIGR
jgi:hypothetical protein